jgi:PKHD-type hydroxylase
MIAVHSVPEALSGADCARLLEALAEAPARDAGLVRQARDHNLRRADLHWLDEVPGTEWVIERMIDLVRAANREVFDFDITEFAESPQVARYGAEREGHFGWHSDIGEGRLAERRKLTIVVQLSEAEAYEGGDLEVMPGANTIAADRVYYSTYGTNHQMAEIAAEAARAAGAEVRLRRVAETAPAEVVNGQDAWKAQAEKQADIPVVTPDDMDWADAYIFSAPTRFGAMPSQVRAFIDTLGGLWGEGKLANKAVSAMTSAERPRRAGGHAARPLHHADALGYGHRGAGLHRSRRSSKPAATPMATATPRGRSSTKRPAPRSPIRPAARSRSRPS